MAAYIDPRLRGLNLGSLSGARPAALVGGPELAALAYAVRHGDPYAQVAFREQQLGRRSPAPYAAPSALAGETPFPDARYQSQYQDLHAEHAVHAAPSVAGRRQTHWGAFGEDRAQEIPWSARDKFGYGRIGARGGGGYSEEWDMAKGMYRRSGRFFAATRSSQMVDPRYPYLHIVARGEVTLPAVGQVPGATFNGNAHIRVTAGLHETGGAEVTREFWVGGGFTAQFDMSGWDQVTIEVIDILAGTRIEFAWVTNGLQNSDQTLYLPRQFNTDNLTFEPVPEGAYAIVIEDPDLVVVGNVLTLEWQTINAGFLGANQTMSITVDDGASGSGNQFGVPLPVLGTGVDMTLAALGTTIDAVWFLRPI